MFEYQELYQVNQINYLSHPALSYYHHHCSPQLSSIIATVLSEDAANGLTWIAVRLL